MLGIGTLAVPDRVSAPASENARATERGGALYAAYCLSCHGDRDGRGGAPGVPGHGPGGHTWIHPDCALIDIISNGRTSELYPVAMPAWRAVLTDADIRSIIAYLETWWTPEQIAFRRARAVESPSCS
jgi:mono/diheme cytochrome c family protein